MTTQQSYHVDQTVNRMFLSCCSRKTPARLGGLCVNSDACRLSVGKYGGINVSRFAFQRRGWIVVNKRIVEKSGGYWRLAAECH